MARARSRKRKLRTASHAETQTGHTYPAPNHLGRSNRTEIYPQPRRAQVADRIAKVILDFVSKIPETEEPASSDPLDRAHSIVRRAAWQSAAAAGTLALPPGLLGLLTIVPDLAAVWRIQAQMVADIAAAFNVKARLGREQMLYCLFRHAAAQAVRDLVVRAGERLLVRRVALRALQSVARRIGFKLTQRIIAKNVLRWLPIVGPLGVGAYAYYDTAQVGATAIVFFQSEPPPAAARAKRPRRPRPGHPKRPGAAQTRRAATDR